MYESACKGIATDLWPLIFETPADWRASSRIPRHFTEYVRQSRKCDLQQIFVDENQALCDAGLHVDRADDHIPGGRKPTGALPMDLVMKETKGD